jgi:hypothetical protein
VDYKNMVKLVLLSVLFATGAAFAGDGEVIRLSEPVAVTDTYEVFGSPLPESGDVMEIGQLIENSEKYQDKDVLVSTRIAKVCQKKGCFFIAQHGADSVRITFEDYGFFIPTDSGGKTVTLAGNFSRKTVSKEETEHIAEDLGEEPPENVPEFQYSIVATGISIPRS